jgi:predicted ATPase/DNA-binding XRE family transcriptional regulator
VPKHLGDSPELHPGTSTPGTPFGDLLREYRVRAGLSQEDLAERAQISAAAIGAIERGTRKTPYRSTVSFLAKALALSQPEAAAFQASRTSKRSGSPSDIGAHVQVQRTSFVGRDADIARILELLGNSRLVTLTGSGGIGKTRAALEAAKQLAGAAWGEICFVDLSPLSDGDYIAIKIASAIQPPIADRVETASALASALVKRRMILILDNCEHIVTAAAHAADLILASCPHVTILATTREPLNIAGEVIYRLPSLSFPQQVPDRLDEAHRYSAVDLFIQRAEAADPRASFDAQSLRAIVNIARRLDGIPLAIELAAAQLPILGLQTLEKRLEDHFNIPAGRRDLPARQQTVMATILWSYELLTVEERQVLCDVSIFCGFTLAAAEFVCERGSFERPAILRVLSALVNKSLVNIEHVRGGARYTLLDSVRSFGLARLRESGDGDSLSRRRAEWLTSVGTQTDNVRPEIPGDVLTELLPDVDNIRAALAWALEADSQDDRALGGRIVIRLHRFWALIDRSKENGEWVEKALDRIDEAAQAPLVAQLLLHLIIRKHEEGAVLALIERAIPLFDRIGDRRGTARLHSVLTFVFALHGRLAEAEQSSDRALALIVAERMQQTLYHAGLLINRSLLRVYQGRLDEARADIRAAERTAVSLGDRYYVVTNCWNRSAVIELAAGNFRIAIENVERMSHSEFASWPEVPAMVLHLNANIALQSGDLRSAAGYIREVLQPQYDSEFVSCPGCEYAATLAALRGDGIAAARLAGFISAQESRTQFRRDPTRQVTRDMLWSSLHQQLSSETITSAGAEGSRLALDEAIAEALAVVND